MDTLATTALRHLLDFARTDIQEFDDISQARHTIAMVAVRVSQYSRRKRLVLNKVQAWVPEIRKALPGGANTLCSNNKKQLRKLQATLNKCLAELFPVDGFGDLPGGIFCLPVPTEKLDLQRQNAGDAASVELRFVAKSWKDAFWLSVAALIEEFGSKLRRCQECKAVYLRTGRQSYCRDQCARRARNRRHTPKAGRRKK